MKNVKVLAVWEVIIATLFLGANGTFVQLVSLSAELILFFRALLAFLVLFFVVLFSRHAFRLKSRGDYLRVFLLGIFMTINWLFFFYAIKVSTVAVGMIAVFTFPIMTTFLEPYFVKEKIAKRDVISAIFMFAGVLFLMPEFSLENDVTLGIVFGLVSSLAYAFRNIFSKKMLQTYSSTVLMCYQAVIMVIFMLPFVFYAESIIFAENDIWYLLFLGVLGTALGHTLFVKSMRHLSARKASVITSAQPVYGTLLAFFVLNEVPTLKVIIGGLIIVVVVTFEALKHKTKDVLLD